MARATALVPPLICTEINAVRNPLHQKATEQVDGRSSYDWESLPCVNDPERLAIPWIRIARPEEMIAIVVMKEHQPAFRTVEGWATIVLLEVGAIRECEEHGWMSDRSYPHARERALFIARHEPPLGISSERAVATVRDVLDTIGDTCPECPPA
jgi:hypothetical protein